MISVIGTAKLKSLLANIRRLENERAYYLQRITDLETYLELVFRLREDLPHTLRAIFTDSRITPVAYEPKNSLVEFEIDGPAPASVKVDLPRRLMYVSDGAATVLTVGITTTIDGIELSKNDFAKIQRLRREIVANRALGVIMDGQAISLLRREPDTEADAVN